MDPASCPVLWILPFGSGTNYFRSGTLFPQIQIFTPPLHCYPLFFPIMGLYCSEIHDIFGALVDSHNSTCPTL